MIACCGLDCERCDAWMATRDNDDGRRQETARKWSQMYQARIEPRQIVCHGCREDGVRFFHCDQCEIRRCCLQKGLENCAACPDYICATLAGFIKMAPEAGAALAQLRRSNETG